MQARASFFGFVRDACYDVQRNDIVTFFFFLLACRTGGGVEDELRREQGDLFHSPRFRSSVGEVIVNSIRFLPDVRFFFIEFYDSHPVVVIFFFLIEVGLLWLGYVTVKDDLRAEAEAADEASQ